MTQTPDRTTPPEVYPYSEITLPGEHVETLPSGTVLHILSGGDQPLARLSLYREGGSLDSPSLAAAAIASDTQRETTASLSGAEIADAMDFAGARLNARLADHYANIDLLVLSDRLPGLFDTLRSVITEAVFPADVVSRTAAKLSAARATELTRVSFLASRAVRSAMAGPGHPASRLEMPDDILAVTPEAVSEAYRRMASAPLHAFLGGGLSAQVIDSVKDFLASLPSPTIAPGANISVVPYSPQPPATTRIDVPDARQAAVSMAIPAIPRSHPDYIPLRLAVMALGGYFGSRLMQNIRERRGLTYGISASLLGSAEGAFMEIDAQADARYVDAVIEETRLEIARLASDPPASDELRRIRLQGWSALAASADSPLSALDYYITRLLVGTPSDYFQRQLQAIETLTSDEIARVASLYLSPEDLRISIAGA